MTTVTPSAPAAAGAALDSYFAAAAGGDSRAVSAALKGGIDINAQDRKRQTGVLLAAKGGHLELVGEFIASGADIDLQDQTCLNPFLFGCIAGELPLVQATVTAGTDLERLTRFGGNGLTPAAEKGHVDVVRYLLSETDINVNLTNTIGWTALIEAVILGDGGETYQEIVRLLLAHGAEPGLTDEWGTSPHQLALEKGFTDIASIIAAA